MCTQACNLHIQILNHSTISIKYVLQFVYIDYLNLYYKTITGSWLAFQCLKWRSKTLVFQEMPKISIWLVYPIKNVKADTNTEAWQKYEIQEAGFVVVVVGLFLRC